MQLEKCKNGKQNYYFFVLIFQSSILWLHHYQTLTNREIFKACEVVRMGWHKKPFQYRGKEFLFRGILKCAVSGNLITSDTKSKKYENGKISEWTYLRAWSPEDPKKAIWVREDEILRQIEEVLKTLQIKNPEILKQIMII
ncbi:hypothetical protein [Candidatus Tisiphia endosymbiont of Sialis lutaria]|uniref:hypothetical protein n=1 Tax=Candidatus Tisiphia endosymbiont of Sialis lutaria TaxID=2029164 RepID=UPI00312C8BFB